MGRLLARAAGLRKSGVLLALAGLLLAAALSFGISLAVQTRTARALPPSLARRAASIDVSFQATDAAPSRPQSGSQNVQGNRDVGNSQAQRGQAQRGQELSRAQAVALVQRRYRARVVRATLVQSTAGRPVYEFRLLSAGTAWSVRIDAYTGAEVP